MSKSRKPSGGVSHISLINQIYSEAASLEGRTPEQLSAQIDKLKAKVRVAKVGIDTCAVSIQAHQFKVESVKKFLGL